MATNFFKIKKGIQLDAVTGSTVTVEGDIALNDTSKQVELHNGSTVESISTTTNTQTVTNKTWGDAPTYTQVATPTTPSSGFNKIYPKSDGYFYSLDPNGAERKIGSGAGLINYITNPDAEGSTTGWVTYADAAGNTPVDATGGSPSSTWTRTTSTPLRGTGSFLWTRTANNRQGEGVSFAFTIDNADQAKPLAITFDYKNASGTFFASDGITAPSNDGTTTQNAGNSDLEVFVYDVTNSVLIPVSPQVLTSSSTGAYTFKGVFQSASNSTSYRLALHTARSTAVAFTEQFDNFFVGPQSVSYGAPMDDWNTNRTFTPASAAFGSISNSTFFSRREGDSLRVWGRWQNGTVAAAAGSIALPVTIDTNKVNSLIMLGTVWLDVVAGAATATTNNSVIFYDGSDATKVFLGYRTASNAFVKDNGSNFGSTSEYVSVEFVIPVSGWSSTVLMSNDTDTRIVAADYYLSANQTINDSTYTKVVFDTKRFDTHAAYSSGLFTCPVSGYYRVSASLTWSLSSATGQRIAAIYKNGANVGQIGDVAGSSATYNATTGGSRTIQCNAGDTLGIYGYQDRGGTLAIGGDAGFSSWVSIERLTGPSSIAISESVNCHYQMTATQTGTSGTQINFDSKLYDSHSAVTTTSAGSNGTWKFTAPSPGKYSVKVYLVPNTTWGANSAIRLYKNGSTQIDFGALASGSGLAGNGTTSVSLLAGDTIDVRPTGAIGTIYGQAGLAGTTWVAIERVGN